MNLPNSLISGIRLPRPTAEYVKCWMHARKHELRSHTDTDMDTDTETDALTHTRTH